MGSRPEHVSNAADMSRAPFRCRARNSFADFRSSCLRLLIRFGRCPTRLWPAIWSRSKSLSALGYALSELPVGGAPGPHSQCLPPSRRLCHDGVIKLQPGEAVWFCQSDPYPGLVLPYYCSRPNAESSSCRGRHRQPLWHYLLWRFRGRGAVFKLTPPTKRQPNWTGTVLYNFGSESSLPGNAPYASVTLDGTGNIYCTTCGNGGG